MKPLLLSALILFAIGCKKEHKLAMADLQFADYEKEFIAKNKVDSIYHSDPHHGMIFPMPTFYDTLLADGYNVNGQKTFEGHGNWGGSIGFSYNSIGMLDTTISRSCMTQKSYLNYEWKGYTLYETTYTPSWREPTRISTTAAYTFNCDGKLATKKTKDFTIEYMYDGDKLVEEKGISTLRRYRTKVNNYSRKIYCTNNVLDSAIYVFCDYFDHYTAIEKTYYDKRGLKYKEVKNDTTIIWFKHHIRL